MTRAPYPAAIRAARTPPELTPRTNRPTSNSSISASTESDSQIRFPCRASNSSHSPEKPSGGHAGGSEDLQMAERLPLCRLSEVTLNVEVEGHGVLALELVDSRRLGS